MNAGLTVLRLEFCALLPLSLLRSVYQNVYSGMNLSFLMFRFLNDWNPLHTTINANFVNDFFIHDS